MSSRRTSWPLVAVFTAGYLATYLLPTLVSNLRDSLLLSPPQAGMIGSGLLLGSATAGLFLASRVERAGPVRVARCGMLLVATGFGTAAATADLRLVVLGAVVGGTGSGTCIAVASAGIAARPDPHHDSTAGLLTVSALAASLYLALPYLGQSHRLPFLAIAITALALWPGAARLPVPPPTATTTAQSPLPHRRAGMVLAGAMACWCMAQNSLWGVSGRIGLDQVGMSQVSVGAVFAAALAAGLVGVTGAGLLGTRLGRAVPTGAGTALIGACIVVTACSTSAFSYAFGQIAWNALYPVVLSYLLSFAASLDPRGRWSVLVGSASALGTACGPLLGSVLAGLAGYRGMGLLLCATLVVLAAPLTGLVRHASGSPLLPAPPWRPARTAASGIPSPGSPEAALLSLPVRARGASMRRRLPGRRGRRTVRRAGARTG